MNGRAPTARRHASALLVLLMLLGALSAWAGPGTTLGTAEGELVASQQRDSGGDGDTVGRSPGPGVLSIASVSPWVAPDGEFQVRFEPSTEVPADAQLTVTIHQSIDPDDTLRAEVDEILAGASPGRILQPPETRPLTDYGDPASGSVLTIPIRSRTANSDRILLPLPGIHPVELVLTSAEGPELWSQVVFLNRLPQERQNVRPRPPLQVTLMLPIATGPAVGTDGTSTFTLEEQSSLRSIATLLEEAPDAPLTLAARPNTLDGLSLTDESWAQDLLAAIGDPDAEHGLLGLPYVSVDSGGLIASGNPAELSHQIQLGRDTIRRVADREPTEHTWAFDDTVTPSTLSALARSGIDSMLLPATALELPPGVDADEVATRPVQLEGDSGIRALAFDGGVSARLAGTANEPGGRAHEVVTMLMATWFDHTSAAGSPGPASVALITGATDPRVVAALLPSLGDNGPLVADPDAAPLPSADADTTEETVGLAPRRPSDQGPAVDVARDSRRITDAYRSMTGEADPDLWAWQRVIDQTMSSALDDGSRLEQNLAVRAAIDERVGAIEPPRPRSVVVTSRDATVPLRFRNDLGFDVELVMRARSPRLAIDGGDSRAIVLHPGENRIDLPITVRAPGESLLRIELSSPSAGISLDGPLIPVRSTAISGVGAALSIVSFLFLIGWWVHTHRRDRRNGAKLAGGHPSAPGAADSLPSGGG